MRKLHLVGIGVIMALVTAGSIAGATTALAAPARPAAVSNTTNSASPGVPGVPGVLSPRNCPNGSFCSYNDAGSPATPCLYTSAPTLDWPSDCANADEAIYNYVPDTWKTRLYYLYSGWNVNSAWMCIDGGDYLDNVSGYKFDQGDGRLGYNDQIWHNIASDAITSGSCNPNE